MSGMEHYLLALAAMPVLALLCLLQGRPRQHSGRQQDSGDRVGCGLCSCGRAYQDANDSCTSYREAP